MAHASEVADLLDLPDDIWKSKEFVEAMAGNRQLDGMDPYATCYGGHQFGNWAGQLGDGRAINLGEIVNQNQERWVLQLKGAGPTPYSRSADGLAVLRSSVREFLCSEAMHHLGVPTTRALSLVLTGDQVMRDMFYSGNPQLEPGAIVCRVAPSFTRFGSFQIFTSRGEIDVLKQLAGYTLRLNFPHLGEPSPDAYAALFDEVCQKTAKMIVHWMRVGFVHGVMNTDNMSILGLTIDYGPYGWLENYDPNWTPNTTDASGRRYRFGHQPQIALWNLAQLGNAIYPLVNQTEPLEESLGRYQKTFEEEWQSMIASKLGFNGFDPKTDQEITSELFAILQLAETDMTIFFRNLAKIDVHHFGRSKEEPELPSQLKDAYYVQEQLTEEVVGRTTRWIELYAQRASSDGNSIEDRQDRMNAVNPKYVLRNYLAQLAIDKSEKGDHSQVLELLEVLRRPYDEQPGKEEFARRRPDWARNRPGCSMLSCSS